MSNANVFTDERLRYIAEVIVSEAYLGLEDFSYTLGPDDIEAEPWHDKAIALLRGLLEDPLSPAKKVE
jgi:hypothetical protein